MTTLRIYECNNTDDAIPFHTELCSREHGVFSLDADCPKCIQTLNEYNNEYNLRLDPYPETKIREWTQRREKLLKRYCEGK